MKNFLLTFFTISLLFISCSDDSDTVVSASESDLVGTWKLSELYSENTKITAATTIGISTTIDIELTSKDYINSVTTFSNTPKEAYHNGSFVLVSKLSALGQTETFEKGIIADPKLKSDWSLTNGNMLNFSLQNEITDEQVTAEIISLDENNLKIKVTLSENYDVPDGFNSEISNAKIDGTLYISYTK